MSNSVDDFIDEDDELENLSSPSSNFKLEKESKKSSNWNGFFAALIVGGPYLLLLWAIGWLNAGSFIVGIILIGIVINLKSK